MDARKELARFTWENEARIPSTDSLEFRERNE